MPDAPYHLADRGVGLGEFSKSQVEAGLATGRFASSVFSWCEGEARWVPLSARSEFIGAAQAFRSLMPVVVPAWEAGPGLARKSWRATFDTFRSVIFHPRSTAEALRKSTSIRNSLWWLGRTSLLAAVLFYFVYALLSAQVKWPTLFSAGALPAIAVPAGVSLGRLGSFVGAVLVLVMLLVPTAACLTQALLYVVGGGRGGLMATTRAMVYVVGAVLLIAWFPLLNCVLPLLVFGLLLVFLSVVHGDSVWKPLLALLGLGFISCCASVAASSFALWPFFSPTF
jgi:hypothetical protein